MSNSKELDAESVEVDVINKSAPSAVHTLEKVVLSPAAELAISTTKHMANEIGRWLLYFPRRCICDESNHGRFDIGLKQVLGKTGIGNRSSIVCFRYTLSSA